MASVGAQRQSMLLARRWRVGTPRIIREAAATLDVARMFERSKPVPGDLKELRQDWVTVGNDLRCALEEHKAGGVTRP